MANNDFWGLSWTRIRIQIDLKIRFQVFLEEKINTIFTSLIFVGESVFLKGSITRLIFVTKHQ